MENRHSRKQNTKNQQQNQPRHSRRSNNKRRIHKCALCGKELRHESYSDHYCRTGIEIKASSYLKKLLRKESIPRQNFPQVQHVWADPHATQENVYLLKIKAPPDIIPDFIEELEAHLPSKQVKKQIDSNQTSRPVSPFTEEMRNSPTPGSHASPKPRSSTPHSHASPTTRPRSHASPKPRSSTPRSHASPATRPRSSTPARLICSFYNSPDGCTNENCQRLHVDDPEEKARLLSLKKIIEKSKVLNPAIKGYVEMLNLAAEQNYELFEAIQRNFNINLRQPTEKPFFQDNLNYIQSSIGFGYELDDLRQELKMISRRCYNNKNPKLLEQLADLITYTHERVQEMEKLQVTEEKIYLKSKEIYDAQTLSRCICVI